MVSRRSRRCYPKLTGGRNGSHDQTEFQHWQSDRGEPISNAAGKPGPRRKNLEGQSERPLSNTRQLHLVRSRHSQTRRTTRVDAPNPSQAQPEPCDDFGHFEPFVDEEVVANFLDLTPRRVLELAREGMITSHAIGRTRKTWRFRISEVAADMESWKQPARAKMPQAVPGTKERNRLG